MPQTVLRFNGSSSHGSAPRHGLNGLGRRWEAALAALDAGIDTTGSGDTVEENGGIRVRRAVPMPHRKPTPLQTARWNAVQKAKRRGLSIRDIAQGSDPGEEPPRSCGSGTLSGMERARFEGLVAEALDGIPDEIGGRLDNVDVVVDDWPSQGQLLGSGIDEGEYLLGLYEGLPLTERDDYNMVLPDKITLFQGAIQAICSNDEEIVREIRDTLIHEVGHHFGIDDDRLYEMGL